MDVFTIQLSKWRVARNRDIVFMDTTVKSGNSIFAPTWDIVLGYKAYTRGEGGIDEATYTQRYHELMNTSWKQHRGEWMAVLESKEPLAIACYCKPGEFCHRHLLKDIFEKVCQAKGIPFYYYGELT